MYKLLVIEDDNSLCDNLMKNLVKWNFEIHKIEDFENVIREFMHIKPQLILMDINLPFFDGFYWCKKIRDISKIPIIFLSSRDSNMDIIMAVNQGGDDYITKPFSLDILITKIQALLRRVYDYKDDSIEIIEYNGVILDIDSGKVTYHNKQADLTKNELKIMNLLMRNKTKVISREKLMKFLWDNEYFANDNTLTRSGRKIRK